MSAAREQSGCPPSNGRKGSLAPQTLSLWTDKGVSGHVRELLEGNLAGYKEALAQIRQKTDTSPRFSPEMKLPQAYLAEHGEDADFRLAQMEEGPRGRQGWIRAGKGRRGQKKCLPRPGLPAPATQKPQEPNTQAPKMPRPE